MKLVCRYELRAQRRLKLDFPFRIDVNKVELECATHPTDECAYPLIAEIEIVPSAIRYVEEPVMSPHGVEFKNRGLKVSAKQDVSDAARFLSRFMSFACQTPVTLLASGRNSVVADTETDREFLENLPTTDLLDHFSISNRDYWQSPRIVLSEDNIERLREREVALAIYADALRVQERVAMFRELWRILESAFRQADDELVRSLARFGPLLQLGVHEDELRDFHILRGRASHAQSRAGLREYDEVSQLASEATPRLRSIVECVMLHKKNWGFRDGEHTPLGNQMCFVDGEGIPTICVLREAPESNSPEPSD